MARSRWNGAGRREVLRAGAYLRRYMTKTMQGVRFLGMGIASVGAWGHRWWLLPVGGAVILWGWFGRCLLDREHRSARR